MKLCCVICFSVSTLKLAIEKKTKVPSNLLVLLVSGGEVLQSDHMVSSYSAGTDSNPIYMFSKPSMKESHMKQSSKLTSYPLDGKFLFLVTETIINLSYLHKNSVSSGHRSQEYTVF